VHTPDRIPLIYSLSKCVVAARAFKLRVIDGVFLALNDPEVRTRPFRRRGQREGQRPPFFVCPLGCGCSRFICLSLFCV
jgi:hypothetical protein